MDDEGNTIGASKNPSGDDGAGEQQQAEDPETAEQQAKRKLSEYRPSKTKYVSKFYMQYVSQFRVLAEACRMHHRVGQIRTQFGEGAWREYISSGSSDETTGEDWSSDETETESETETETESELEDFESESIY